MKNNLFVFLLFLPVLSKPFSAEAKILTGEVILIEERSTEEMFAIGNDIEVMAPIENEFIGIGEKIFAHSNVGGDFIGIGLNLNFKGIANRDVYLIGDTVNVGGIVRGSITALGINMNIETPVEGNLRVGAERIRVRGTVTGKTIIWGENVSIEGKFKDVVLYGSRIHFAPDTLIDGDLTYTTPEKMDLSSINITGKIKWNRPYIERLKKKSPMTLLRRFYTFFSLLFPVLIMLGFFPNLFQQTATLSGRKFLQCFGTGLIFITITVIALPLIFITIVGAPLGLIVASLFFSSVYISRVFPSIFVGRILLFKMTDKRLTWGIATIIGILLFTTISINPKAKILLNIISIPAGFGALFMGRMKLLQRLRKEKIL